MLICTTPFSRFNTIQAISEGVVVHMLPNIGRERLMVKVISIVHKPEWAVLIIQGC